MKKLVISSALSLALTLLSVSVIVYPFPFIDVLIHLSQKFMNTIHLTGPPTDPCRTPLPCAKGFDMLTASSMTVVVAPGPSCGSAGLLLPASRLISICIASSGIPSALQLSACDQYSQVSNACVRSRAIACSCFLLILASSIASAITLSGAAVPPPAIAPYWLMSSTSCSSMASVTLLMTTLSYSLVTVSINAIGLTLSRLLSPASVFGSSLSRAVFISSGILLSVMNALNIFVIITTAGLPADFIMSMVTFDSPGAVPALASLIAVSVSSSVISTNMLSHQPSCCAFLSSSGSA